MKKKLKIILILVSCWGFAVATWGSAAPDQDSSVIGLPCKGNFAQVIQTQVRQKIGDQAWQVIQSQMLPLVYESITAPRVRLLGDPSYQIEVTTQYAQYHPQNFDLNFKCSSTDCMAICKPQTLTYLGPDFLQAKATLVCGARGAVISTLQYSDLSLKSETVRKFSPQVFKPVSESLLKEWIVEMSLKKEVYFSGVGYAYDQELIEFKWSCDPFSSKAPNQ